MRSVLAMPSTPAPQSSVTARLQAVQIRIQRACIASGRSADEVRLLAVSKTFGTDAILATYHAGQRDFGENYIQEAQEKIIALQQAMPQAVWHCIGPVQSNKCKIVATHFDWLHSLDRLKIAERLSEHRPAHMPALNVCLQTNIDDSPSKSGAKADIETLRTLAQAVHRLPGLRLRGIMAIPDPSDASSLLLKHRRAKMLFDALAAELPGLDTLSLGMSADLEAAIAAGSTMVRVGSALFGHRVP